MTDLKQIHKIPPGKLWLTLTVCLALTGGGALLASAIQHDFGRLTVENVEYKNANGTRIRAKLLYPADATSDSALPGVVYVHGYQNNREASDPYCIELARRGFAALCIDAIGRGNSGLPPRLGDPGFDSSFGTLASIRFIKSQPFVNPEAIGLMGHSLGAEMAYEAALKDPTIRALSISGFAYTKEASFENPKNMLMIIGIFDEFRTRMTGIEDIANGWMRSSRTKAVIDATNPQAGVTYGDFEDGTARRVELPRMTHIQISHSTAAVAQAIQWMTAALKPEPRYKRNPHDQTWPVKEWATLISMLAGLASCLPLLLLLLRLPWFGSLAITPQDGYFCSRRNYLVHAGINGLLLCLYLPLVFTLFGIHIYVVRLDLVFPLMIVNGIVWWFFVVNLVGLFLFRRWARRQHEDRPSILAEVGVSYGLDGFAVDWTPLWKTVLLAILMVTACIGLEHILEKTLITDYRFMFPFASDLTLERLALFPRYFPFILFGFLITGFFIHGTIRIEQKATWLGTWAYWSLANTLALVIPLLVLLAAQYLPLFAFNIVPFVGPGGVFVSFMINLIHVVGILALVIPISTFCYLATGRPYLGALVCAGFVTWMFISSHVIAPIPI
jgi:uncharacterized protein